VWGHGCSAWAGRAVVAGSTMLSESFGQANKPSVQGLSDIVMGTRAALRRARWVVWHGSRYETLTLLARSRRAVDRH